MRHLFTIALLALVFGFGHLALANGGAASVDPIEKIVVQCKGAHTLHSPKQKCKQQQAAADEKVEANPAVQENLQKRSKAPSVGIKTEQEIKEIKEVAEPKKESTNLTFNFLYYLFYKFSLSDFFQTPSYNIK